MAWEGAEEFDLTWNILYEVAWAHLQCHFLLPLGFKDSPKASLADAITHLNFLDVNYGTCLFPCSTLHGNTHVHTTEVNTKYMVYLLKHTFHGVLQQLSSIIITCVLFFPLLYNTIAIKLMTRRELSTASLF